MAINPIKIVIKLKDEASAALGGLKSRAAAVASAIAGYFGVRFLVGAIREAADLEEALSEVQAVSGATADEMMALRAAAEDAGATTRYTATEAANALGELARAGLSAQQSIAALPGTLALAQAGKIALADAAAITTKTLAGFTLASDQAGRVADVLAKGANASNTSVRGLAEALSYAAPMANSLGLSLEDTVALLGKFADGGIDASRAGTALNSILAQFGDPASKFRAALAALGITTNNFGQALRELAARGVQGEAAIRAVGLEAGPALRSLLNQGIGALDELTGKLRDAAGAAGETAGQMEGNLNGALRGLSSAWSAVKTVLFTPVLPVIRRGVDELAQSLRAAVQDGTVARFGAAIAEGFQAALDWGRRFLGEVDFVQLAADMRAFADRAGESFRSVKTTAENAGNSVRLVWGTMSAGANTVLAVVYKVGEAFALVARDVMTGLALLREGLAKVSFGSLSAGFAEAAEDARRSSGAFGAAADALAEKARQAIDGVQKGAETARGAWAGLTGAMAQSDAQARVSQAVMREVSETLKAVGGDATAQGQQVKAAAVLQTEALRQTRAEVAAMRVEYEAALQAGDVQTALSKLDAMRQRLAAVRAEAAGVGQEAEAASRRIAEAFANAGVKSRDELANLARAARSDFDLIKASGQATAEGLQQAYRRYAEAAIAANGGAASETLKAEARMQGLEIATDGAGRTIVRAMREGAGAIDQVADRSAAAAQGFYDMAAAAASAAQKIAEINQRYARPAGGSVTGNTREERLAGQNAVDARLQFEIAQKLQRGQLTQADLPAMQAVIASLQQQQTIDRGVDRMSAGAYSLDGMRDRAQWAAVLQQLQTTVNRMGGQGQGPGRTVTVKLDTGRGLEAIQTDEAGADALIRALQSAGLRAGI